MSSPYPAHQATGAVYRPHPCEREASSSNHAHPDDPRPAAGRYASVSSRATDITDLTSAPVAVRPATRIRSPGPSASSSSRLFSTVSATVDMSQRPTKQFSPHNGDLLGSLSESASQYAGAPNRYPLVDAQDMDIDESYASADSAQRWHGWPAESLPRMPSADSAGHDGTMHSHPRSTPNTNSQLSEPPALHNRHPSEPDYEGRFLFQAVAQEHGAASPHSRRQGLYPYPYRFEHRPAPVPAHVPTYTRQAEHTWPTTRYEHDTRHDSTSSAGSTYHSLTLPSAGLPNSNPSSQASMRVPPRPEAVASSDPGETSGLQTLFLGYGFTGPYLEETARPQGMPPLHASSAAPSASRLGEGVTSSVPTVPPPRTVSQIAPTPARPNLTTDFLESSSSGIRSRSTSGGSDVANAGLERRSNEIRPRSQFVAHRLGRLDALRTQYARVLPTPTNQIERPTPWLDRDWDMDSNASTSTARWSNEAAQSSSRQGRYGLDETRDLRSRPETLSRVQPATWDREADVTHWNQEVIDSVGRRVVGTQSPASALRRLHDLHTSQLDQETTAFRPYDQARRPWPTLWGAIPIDTSAVHAAAVSDRMHLPMMYNGWLSEATMQGHADRNPRLSAAMQGDEALLDPHRAMYGRYGPTGLLFEDRLGESTSEHCGILAHLRLRDNMSEEERTKVLKSLVRGVDRLPSAARKKLADDTVSVATYDQLESTAQMEKDLYCSVCHDEVSPAS